MTLRLPFAGKQFVTLISAYVLTMTNLDDIKEKFYKDLTSTITAVPGTDKLIIYGDFKARIGADYSSWEGVLGKNGIGTCNSNGTKLLQTCTAHELLITNFVFRIPKDAPSLQALALNRLHHCQTTGQALGLFIEPTTHKHQDWFNDNDESIKELLQEKHCLHRTLLNTASAYTKAAFTNIKRLIQCELLQMQDK